MNIEQIRKELNNGFKITHEWFTSDEWVEKKNGLVMVDENGTEIDEDDFWQSRMNISDWNKGWKKLSC